MEWQIQERGKIMRETSLGVNVIVLIVCTRYPSSFYAGFLLTFGRQCDKFFSAKTAILAQATR